MALALPRLKDAKIDRVNLEFAYHDTGSADDLKLLPPHIDVGMGVVDVQAGAGEFKAPVNSQVVLCLLAALVILFGGAPNLLLGVLPRFVSDAGL